MCNLPSGSKSTHIRWLVVGLLMGIAFLAHFNRLGMAVAGKEHFIGPDRISAEQMGLVYSTFLFAYMLGMLPGGYLIDRIGPRRAMTGMGIGLGLCSALTGLLGWTGLAIPALFLPLMAIRGIAGASSVPLHPGAARTVSLWTPLTERSTANGLVTAGAVIGIASTYPVFGWLIDRVGWPAAFVVAGTALVVLSLVWAALVSDSAGTHPKVNDAERALVVASGNPQARTRPTTSEIFGLFTNRSLVLLTLSYGALSYLQYMFFYWVEYYFGEVLKLPDSESRSASFIVMLSMAAGMAGGGWVADRLGRRFGFRRGCQVVGIAGMGASAGLSLLGLTMAHPDAIVACFALSMGSLGLCEGGLLEHGAGPRTEERGTGRRSRQHRRECRRHARPGLHPDHRPSVRLGCGGRRCRRDLRRRCLALAVCASCRNDRVASVRSVAVAGTDPGGDFDFDPDPRIAQLGRKHRRRGAGPAKVPPQDRPSLPELLRCRQDVRHSHHVRE
jgi:ACS family D-galactonate transporter-like MFS transporter